MSTQQQICSDVGDYGKWGISICPGQRWGAGTQSDEVCRQSVLELQKQKKWKINLKSKLEVETEGWKY